MASFLYKNKEAWENLNFILTCIPQRFKLVSLKVGVIILIVPNFDFDIIWGKVPWAKVYIMRQKHKFICVISLCMIPFDQT